MHPKHSPPPLRSCSPCRLLTLSAPSLPSSLFPLHVMMSDSTVILTDERKALLCESDEGSTGALPLFRCLHCCLLVLTAASTRPMLTLTLPHAGGSTRAQLLSMMLLRG